MTQELIGNSEDMLGCGVWLAIDDIWVVGVHLYDVLKGRFEYFANCVG